MKNKSENITLSYEYIGKLLLKYWYLTVLSIATCFGIAYYELLKELPSYQISGTVLIEEDKSAGSVDGGIQGITLNVGNTLGNEIQMLRSRNMMEEVVQELSLEVLYEHVGKHKRTDLYSDTPIRLNYSENIGALAWQSLDIEILDSINFTMTRTNHSPRSLRFNEAFTIDTLTFIITRTERLVTDENRQMSIRILPRQYVAQQYANSIGLLRIENSDLIQFSIAQEVPKKGIDLINKLVEIFFRNSLDEKKRQASNTLMFIEERLKYVTDELFDVEKSLENYRKHNNINVGIEDNAVNYVNEITTTNQAMVDMEISKHDLRDVLGQLNNEDMKYEMLLPGLGIKSEAIHGVITQYNTAIAKRKELMVSHESIHPNVVKMESELNDLRNAVRNGINTGIASIDNRIKDLQVGLRPIKDRMNNIPTNQRELLQIMRQQQIKETLFLYLLEKREETAISLAAQIGNARVIDSPTVVSRQPSAATRYYALAFMVGISLPLLLVLLFEQFNDKIQSEAAVQNLGKTTFIGSICRTSGSNKIVIDKNSRSAIAEMFRLLRTNLGFSVAGTERPVVMVSSTQAGDGKTFVCMNLGISLAISGKKVVMLEMDLRRPQLLEYLKEGNPNNGLTNFLVGETQLTKIINKSKINPNLHFISSGPIPPNPSELLMMEKMEELIDKLKARYDYVLIDTPPLGLVTDALLINQYATNTIIVVREKKSRKADVELIRKLSEEDKLIKPGIVLNGVKPSGRRYGGGYYEESKPSIFNRNKKMRPKLKDATVE